MKARRFWRYPEHILSEFRRLLLETDLSASECGRRAGIDISGGYHGSPAKVLRECRRYVGFQRWVNQATGELRPDECTVQCAVDKTGLSKKTIYRRIQTGTIHAFRSKTGLPLRTFSDHAISRIKRLKSGTAMLTPEDIRDIRKRVSNGATHASIAADYPVTRRQISRIASRKQWRESRPVQMRKRA